MKSSTSLVVMAILAALVVVGLFMSGAFQSLFALGWTSLSLSQADFRSSNEFFNDKVWILTVAQGGLAQNAEGTISASDIETESGKRPENDFTINIDYSKQSCNYEIVKDSFATQIYKYNIQEWTNCPSVPSAETADTYCPNGWIYTGKYGGQTKCFCVEPIKITGAVAPTTIETPYVVTTSGIVVSNTQQSESKTFNFASNADTQGFVGSNVYVTWNGDLMRDKCPAKSGYYGFYKDGEWRIGIYSNYDTYKNKYDSLYSDLQGICEGVGFQCYEDDVDQIISDINYWQVQATGYDANQIVDNSTRMDGAVWIRNLQNFVNIPVFTFYVKADWLGIYQPSPDIRITSATSEKFQTNGQIYVELYNYGEDGNTNVWAECQSPFSFAGNTQLINIPSGTSKTATLPITVSTNQEICKPCTVYSDDGFHTHSMGVQVCADPEFVCEANVKRCTSENTIEICNEFGSGWDVIETCPSGQVCKYINRIPECVDDDTPVPPTPEENWLWLIIPVFIALFALVGYAAMDMVGAGIGGILGGIMGYVIYWFLTLPWWAQWLIGIGIGAGGAIIIYILLFGGGLLTLAVFYSIIKE